MAGGLTRPSLCDFAKDVKRGVPSWGDRLPADIQDEILSSDASTATIVTWLHGLHDEGWDADLGVDLSEATSSKIDGWRRKARRERTKKSE